MKWEIAKLGKIAIIRTGKLDSNAAVIGGRYPFFTCDPNTLSIDVWAYDTEAVLLAGNNASGNYTAKYYKGKFNAYQRTYIIESTNEEKLNIRYLCYALNQQLQLLKTMSSGSTTKFLTVRMLDNLDIPLLGINIQTQIVNILSAYDDLIENNQKQIKLLEEAARRLYKEWFVDLRFPGHENTKIVDGVPEGWRISSIYDVFDIKYGKNLPTSKITKAGQYPVYGASGVIGYYNEKNCDDYATLVTSRGNGSGDVFRTHHKQSYITNNSFIARRNDKNSFIENEFTFQLFSNTDFKKLCTGSAQPQLTNTSIQKIKILLPNRQLIEKYQRCTIEMSEKQEALYQEQRALTQARNRLLPKLMNGTVEV